MPAITASLEKDLSSLALDAATELDAHLEPSQAVSSDHIQALAEELRRTFPGEDRPDLPPETIGLVCGVVQRWGDDVADGGYKHSSQIAHTIADRLTAPELPQDEINDLIKFCLSLYYATQPRAVMHDMPTDHPDFLSMC